MALAHCMLDNWGYKQTLRMWIFIASPLQRLLHERASVLCYKNNACFVYSLLASLCPTAKKLTIIASLRSKVSCNQSTCAPITRAPVIADVCLFYESMTHVLLVSLPHRRTFSDLHSDYGGLEIKSEVTKVCSLEAVINLLSKLFDRPKMF